MNRRSDNKIRFLTAAILISWISGCSGGSSGTTAPPTGNPLPPNKSPVAQNDAAGTEMDTPVAIPVLANDMDPEGAALTIITIGAPDHGAATVDDSGTPADPTDDTVLYTPDIGFTGADTFLYTISDGAQSSDATVSVTVAPVGTPTVAVSGRVMKGPVAGALVSLYAVTGSGQRASVMPVAQAVTDNEGRWTTQVPLPRQALLVVAAGGTFEDEANATMGFGPLIQLEVTDELEAVLLTDESFLVTSIYTNAILLKARHEVGQNNFESVVANNRTLFEDAFGFDLFAVDPTDPANPDPLASVVMRQHAMALGGAANALNNITVDFFAEPAPSFPIIQGLIRDLSDCDLDNQDLDGSIQVDLGSGPQTLNANVDLNVEIARFRNNNFDLYAGTPLVQVDENTCSQSGQAPDPDVEPPVFTSVPPPFAIGATDPSGIAAADPFIQQQLSSVQATDDSNDPVTIVHDAPVLFPLGATLVTFTATDSSGNEALATVVVTVIEDQTAPTVIGPPDIDQFATGVLTSVDLGTPAVSDNVDTTPTVTFTVNPSVSGLLFPVGTFTVTWTAADASGNVSNPVLQSVVIRNNKPTISVIPDQQVDEDEIIGPVVFTVDDIETNAGALLISAVSDNPVLIPPANILLAGTGATRSVTLTPSAATSGMATITIIVTDGDGDNSSTSFLVTVNSKNTPPTFTISGDIFVDEDFSGTATATVIPDPVPPDELGQIVIYTISPPVSFANVSIDPATGVVSVTSLPDLNGSQLLVITANDQQSANNTATQSMILTVNPVNDPPTSTAIGPQTAVVGSAFVLDVSANFSDVDGDTLVFSESGLPLSLSIDSATGIISGTPTAGETGVYSVTVTASDSKGGFASSSFVLTVNP